MRLLVLLLALAMSVSVGFAQCAATPEAAAAASFAFAKLSTATASHGGYRVQDVQVDTLTKRVWVRVKRCDNEAAPAILVPVQAGLGSSMGLTPPSAVTTMAGVPARIAVVFPGDRVRVVADGPSMRLEVEGRALQQAAVGDAMDVSVRTADEPEHRIRGTLRAGHTVEVQP